MKMKRAVIILSGGLDSACMVSYLKKGYQLYGITFAYGQRASEEIKAAKRIAKLLKLKEHKILDIGFMKELYGDSNVLTNTKRKMAFLIGTTIEYSNELGIFFFVLVKTLLSPYNSFMKPISRILCSFSFSNFAMRFAAFISSDAL